MALKCGCFHLINNGFLDQMVQNLKRGRGMGGVIYAFHEQWDSHTDFQFPPLWGFCELTECQLSTENCIRCGRQQDEPAR